VTDGRLAVTADVLPGADTDAEELAKLALRLRAELLELPVDSVRLATDADGTDGAKGAGIAAGGLLILLLAEREVLRGLIGGIRSWLKRQGNRTIKLTIGDDTLELTGIGSAEQDRLVDMWVSRHAGPD
jgi:hypothetical protein